MKLKILLAIIIAFPLSSWAQPPIHQSLTGNSKSLKSYKWITTASGSRVYANQSFDVYLNIPKEFSIREEFDYSGYTGSPDSWGINCFTPDRKVELHLSFSGESLADDYKFYLENSESYRPTSLHKLTATYYLLSGYRYLRPISWEDEGAEIIFYRKGVVVKNGMIATVEISCSPEDSRTTYKELVANVINYHIKNFPANPLK